MKIYPFISSFLFSLMIFSCQSKMTETHVSDKPDSSDSAVVISGNIENYSQIAESKEITCTHVGPLALKMTYAEMEEVVGKENIEMDSIYLEGEFQGLATKLWKDTPKEMQIIWAEDQPPFSVISSVRISHPESTYHLPNHISIGSTMPELIEANGGKPFGFYGFGWDYGGTLTSWKGGTMDSDYFCIGGNLSLDTDVYGEETDGIMGDMEITSEHPALKNHRVYLSEITVTHQDRSGPGLNITD